MNKFLSEFIGTFALVTAGCGAIIVNDISGGTITHLGVALVFGLMIMTMIYALGEVSGAHFNPAVSFGFWLANKLSFNDMTAYMLSQAAGAITASIFLKLFFPFHKTLGSTNPHLISSMGDFFFEVLLTFFLMFIIIRVSHGGKEKGLMAGVAVGGMVALEAIFAGPITGASMNPARSLGPSLISGDMDYLWIYLTAPFLGAAAAVYTSKLTDSTSLFD